MRTHRVATLTLTAAVGLCALVGTASTAHASPPQPSDGTVLVESGHQGPVPGPNDLGTPTTSTTVAPHGPGDLAVPPHVDPPVDPFPNGGVIVDPDPGDCDQPTCGPGDLGQPTPEPGGTTGGTDGGTTTGGSTTTVGSTSGGHLPHTGMDVGQELAVGVGLTALGAALVRTARRRRARA